MNVPIAFRVRKMSLARVSNGSYQPRTQFAPRSPLVSFVKAHKSRPIKFTACRDFLGQKQACLKIIAQYKAKSVY